MRQVEVEGFQGVCDGRIMVGCDGSCGVCSTDGDGSIQIRTATADKSTSEESCRKLEALKGCASAARVHYSCEIPQPVRSDYTSEDTYSKICNF